MNYIINKHHRNVPDKVLLSDLRRTARRLGKKYISFCQYEKEGKFHPWTLSKRFGGWNAALVKAKLKVKLLRPVSDEELLGNMKKVWDTLGRQPRWEEMGQPPSEFASCTYSKRFGSWNRALDAFAKRVNNGKYKPVEETPYIKFRIKQNRHKKTYVRKINKYINKGLRFDVLRRDNYKCRLCGASPAVDSKVRLHVDHIIPYSKGGEKTLENLQTLCEECNLGKGAKELTNRK